MRLVLGADLTYFWWSCLAGCLAGILYDIIRIKRRIFYAPDFWVNVEDILFMMVCGVGTVYLAYAVNNGNLRIYSLISGGLCFFGYRLLIGNAVVKFISKGLNRVIEVIYKIFDKVINRILKIINGICGLIKKLCKGSSIMFNKLCRDRRMKNNGN